MVTKSPSPNKPILRGVLHQSAAWSALGGGSVLVAMAPNMRAAIAAGVYALSLVALFTISAVYHRVHWKEPRTRARMRRADHASIFILIAGTYTPISLLALGSDDGRRLLIMIWAGASAGVLLSVLWINAPKALTAAAAVAVGWMIVPYLSQVRAYLRGDLWLVLIGGIAYTIGAIVYAVKRPNPCPRWFGYHEVFHALTLVGALTHFVVIMRMMR
jgi:hemolysin III